MKNDDSTDNFSMKLSIITSLCNVLIKSTLLPIVSLTKILKRNRKQIKRRKWNHKQLQKKNHEWYYELFYYMQTLHVTNILLTTSVCRLV